MAICSFCHAAESYGKQRQCLKCHAEYMRDWRKENAPSKKQRQRDSARSQVSVYVKRGKIKKPENCPKCGNSEKIEAHHPDYKKPREVEWLCRKCHLLHHRLHGFT